MNFRSLTLLLTALFAWTTVQAEEDKGLDRVELRVTSTGPGSVVTVDRGKRDKVAVGDRVTFHARGGATHHGTVVHVDERSARVELRNKKVLPPAGTRGEVAIPRARFASEAEPQEPERKTEEKAPEGVGEKHEPWENTDSEFTQDKPLLAGMKPVRPEERARRLQARAYLIAEITENPEGDFTNSFVRLGTDVVYENLFGHGGVLDVNVELDYLTEGQNDNEGMDLLVQRFSYTLGGTRFRPMRWAFGRFLQDGMPEFGVLDGAEWSKRRANGHSYGASLGFMPEPDDDFDSLSDGQIAAWYGFVSGPDERLTLRGGYQKTWHDGQPDSDLLVVNARFIPGTGWDFHGTIWVDFYTGSDNIKGSGLEITQAIASLVRRGANGSGFDLTFLHQRFPEILRNGEFEPLLAAEIANNRLDRLSLDLWWWMTQKLEIHGFLSGWNDEDGSGGAAEFGVQLRDLLFQGSHADLTGFASAAQFEDVFGVRGSLGRATQKGSWEVFYEISNRHKLNFPNDRDDIIQHRFRLTVTIYRNTWDVSAYGEGVLYDDQLTWTLGVTLQKDF